MEDIHLHLTNHGYHWRLWVRDQRQVEADAERRERYEALLAGGPPPVKRRPLSDVEALAKWIDSNEETFIAWGESQGW